MKMKMFLTRRDIGVALLSICGTLGLLAATQTTGPAIMGSSVFDWNTIAAKPTETGSVRKFFQAPTATLDELECHVTTLNPGATSHPPHQHPNEELIIIREGKVETLCNGEWKQAGPGSVIFNASNVLHGIRNIGDTPATYHVISWYSPGMKPKPAQQPESVNNK